MNLKELRKAKGLKQKEAAKIVEMPIRTYINYENDERKAVSMKYLYIVERLSEYGKIDENSGVLTIDTIKDICGHVFLNYDVDYCYLFGSYAKDKATESSDVDLFIFTHVKGIQFFEMIEELREKLNKKVDLINQNQLIDNPNLVNEILGQGIKIYGKHKE